MNRILTIIILLLLNSNIVNAQLTKITQLTKLDQSTGLEIGGNYKNIEVYIGELDRYEKEIGLTKDLIQRRVYDRLRQRGLNPVKFKYKNRAGFVHIQINVEEKAFMVNIPYARIVSFKDYKSRTYYKHAAVWGRKNIHFGTYDGGINNNDNVEYIMHKVMLHLDVFIRAYIRANRRLR